MATRLGLLCLGLALAALPAAASATHRDGHRPGRSCGTMGFEGKRLSVRAKGRMSCRRGRRIARRALKAGLPYADYRRKVSCSTGSVADSSLVTYCTAGPGKGTGFVWVHRRG